RTGLQTILLVLVDDHNRYSSVSLLQTKADALATIIAWLERANTHFGRPVRRLHSDGGGDFLNNQVPSYCQSCGILQTYTLPHSPQQNGVAESRVREITKIAWCLFVHVSCLPLLWGYALLHAALLTNLYPHPLLPSTTPTELWTKDKPDVSSLRVWGSKAYVLIHPFDRSRSMGKLAPRTLPCIFLVGMWSLMSPLPNTPLPHPLTHSPLSPVPLYGLTPPLPHYSLLPPSSRLPQLRRPRPTVPLPRLVISLTRNLWPLRSPPHIPLPVPLPPSSPLPCHRPVIPLLPAPYLPGTPIPGHVTVSLVHRPLLPSLPLPSPLSPLSFTTSSRLSCINLLLQQPPLPPLPHQQQRTQQHQQLHQQQDQQQDQQRHQQQEQQRHQQRHRHQHQQ
ncbi:unnamed protein product, partial [Closterium sp. NIES-54]